MKKRLSFISVIVVSLLINLIFNFSLWKELFVSKITMSDNIITEFLVETSYQNILHFKNPFITKFILYPFTTNFSLNDPAIANVIFFFFLRPFFNPHQSLILITLGAFLLNNILMYLLLKKLKISQYVSILISLVFGFTPFLSHRVLSHYTYIPIYFFPLTFLLIELFLRTQKSKNKFILTSIFGLFLGLVLLSNFYYFFMIILGIILFIVYWFFQDKKMLFKVIKENFIYFFISIAFFILILTPWILSVYQLIKSEGLVKMPGLGGAITLSADIFNFVTPSEYNPIYEALFNKIASLGPIFYKYNNFFLNSWEKFAYPGIIVVFTYFIVIVLKLFKKLPSSLWNSIKPYFIISLIFALLALGPFLKIFNRWFINLDGVAVVIPLPFLIFHYIPILSTLRAASRFTPMFIFLASIISAYTIDFILKKINSRKSLIFTGLFLVFFIDQLYVIPTKLNQEIPKKIYQSLKNKNQGTVLEIPLTVRDGFRYLGFVHAIQPMAGQLIHGKPIIGGYIARVSDKVFEGYSKTKFISYLAKIIDKGNYNPFKEEPKEPNVFAYPYSFVTINKEIESFNIKYVILKTDEKYSKYVKELFEKVGFMVKKKDLNYILLEK